MCYVPRSRLNSRNVITSFKVHEELDTNKLCSYRACEFINFTVFQQNGYNKSNNVFICAGILHLLPSYALIIDRKVSFVVVIQLPHHDKRI